MFALILLQAHITSASLIGISFDYQSNCFLNYLIPVHKELDILTEKTYFLF